MDASFGSEQFWSAKEVAYLLGVSERTVRVWTEKGILPGFRFGKLWRYSPKEILDFVKRRKNREEE